MSKAQILAALNKRSDTIFTTLAVTGVLTTSVLTAQASFKAADILAREEQERFADGLEEMDVKEKLLLVWPHFIPAATTMGVTITSIFMLNKVGADRLAAMAAMYSVSEKNLTDYQNKVAEKMGEKKYQTIKDDIAQDRVRENPPEKSSVIYTANGNVLFMDSITGRYFESTIEDVRKSVNDINEQVLNQYYASLSEFYDLLGLPSTAISDDWGWNSDALLDVSFSTVLTDDNRPCIYLEYRTAPIRGFNRLV